MARTPEQLWGPIAKAQLATRGVTAGTGFGNTEGLRISGKIFAMLVSGELVVKLPKDRVDELVDSGRGSAVRRGEGASDEGVGIGLVERIPPVEGAGRRGESLRRRSLWSERPAWSSVRPPQPTM